MVTTAAALLCAANAFAYGDFAIPQVKIMKIIPFVVVAMTFVSAPAFAQSDACHDQYAQCVERCGSHPPTMQESCNSSCEAAANQCYAQVYGQPGQVSVPADAQDAHDEAPRKKAAHH